MGSEMCIRDRLREFVASEDNISDVPGYLIADIVLPTAIETRRVSSFSPGYLDNTDDVVDDYYALIEYYKKTLAVV